MQRFSLGRKRLFHDILMCFQLLRFAGFVRELPFPLALLAKDLQNEVEQDSKQEAEVARFGAEMEFRELHLGILLQLRAIGYVP